MAKTKKINWSSIKFESIPKDIGLSQIPTDVIDNWIIKSSKNELSENFLIDIKKARETNEYKKKYADFIKERGEK